MTTHNCDDDWDDDFPVDPPTLTVWPTDDEPEVALWGPDGQPLRWHSRRPIGYRSLRQDPDA